MEDETQCPECLYFNITEYFVYVCVCCGRETCPDCAGRCGCVLEEED